VRNYLFHVFETLGVSTRVELVLYWLQQSNNPSPPHDYRNKKVASFD
jgi:hypothetical protein